MNRVLFESFPQLASVLKGKKVFVLIDSIRIGTGYTLLKNSFDFDRFKYTITFDAIQDKKEGRLMIITSIQKHYPENKL